MSGTNTSTRDSLREDLRPAFDDYSFPIFTDLVMPRTRRSPSSFNRPTSTLPMPSFTGTLRSDAPHAAC
jgi:hypothetical protein